MNPRLSVFIRGSSPGLRATTTTKLSAEERGHERMSVVATTNPSETKNDRSLEVEVPSDPGVSSDEQKAAAPDLSDAPFGRRIVEFCARHQEALLLTCVVAFGLFIRLYKLGSFPDTLNPDESDNAKDALRILAGKPPDNGIFGFDWKPQPALSVYLMSFFFAVFGDAIAVIRLPSALFSTLALLPFYALLRRQCSSFSALLATFLLACNLWYLNFSRSGWENVHISLYLLLAVFFYLKGLDTLSCPSSRTRPLALFAATGLSCALGLYGYFTGRAICLALIVFAPVAFLFHRKAWKKLLLGYAVIGGVAAVLFLPHAIYAWQHLEFYMQRVRVVSIFGNDEFRSAPLAVLWSQVAKNATGFWVGVNNMPRYNPVAEPLLDRVTGGLVLIGMLVSVATKRRRAQMENWLWWVMLLIPWAATQLLTVGTPDGARGVGWLPTLFYFVALGLESLFDLSKRLRRELSLIALTWVIALVVFAGFDNIFSYINWQSRAATREARQPYVTIKGYSSWKQEAIK